MGSYCGFMCVLDLQYILIDLRSLCLQTEVEQ